MRFEAEENRIYLPVTELATYAFRRENPAKLTEQYGFRKYVTSGNTERQIFGEAVPSVADAPVPEETTLSPRRAGEALHHVYQTDARTTIGTTETEVPLEKTVDCGSYSVTVQGYADLVTYDGVLFTIEEIKTVAYFKTGLTPITDTEQFAQAAIYAYLFACQVGVSEIKIRMTYIKRANGDKIAFVATFSQAFLTRLFDSLLERAHTILEAYAERYTVFPKEVKTMPFPYHTIREGQAAFVKTAYRAFKRGESLLVSAPTGIGKTMSALFPALKALGDGCADRIFYLTAKTITGQAALEAARRIAKYAPHLRAVMLCAKEQVCPYRKQKGAPDAMECRGCVRMDGISHDLGKTYISYRERELNALTELLLSDDCIYTLERVYAVAERHEVCPHELALDLSESCSVLFCDYNYVIDDQVRLRRYFKNVQNTDAYFFLFDEAHNLPDRTRNTYSARLTMQSAAVLSEMASSYFAEDSEYGKRVEDFYRAMTTVRELCTDSEYVREMEDGEVVYGYYESDQLHNELIRTVNDLARLLSQYCRDGHEFAEQIESYAKELAKFSFAASFFDNHFRFFGAREGERLTVQILCLDPADILSRMLASARSSLLFSATLAPMDYFREVTGMMDAGVLELESPYERDNLCLIAYDAVSTRLRDRKHTAFDCAAAIAETVAAREGNYLVYFPSYEYMKQVCRACARVFAEEGLDCSLIMQKPGMSYRERERFIEVFREGKHRSIVGFCVLGGMFSEGIDLAGESLIGAILVGTGMPQLSAERNIMAAYYQEKTERGHEFAYTCPGMTKLLQAAGRVIRSETDRGVVVLIDDRLGDPNLKTLFPPHWRHMKYTGDIASLSAILADFWERD